MDLPALLQPNAAQGSKNTAKSSTVSFLNDPLLSKYTKKQVTFKPYRKKNPKQPKPKGLIALT